MRILTLAAVAALSATSFAHAATHASVDRDRDGLISYAEWQFTYGTEESRIGFNYSDWHANDAVANLIGHMENIARACPQGGI